MRANILLGYAVLGLAAVLIFGAVMAMMLNRPVTPGPLDALKPCHLIVGGPTRVYVCTRPTPRAWALQGGEVVDLGPLTGSTRMVPNAR